jgi:hypothetical protein
MSEPREAAIATQRAGVALIEGSMLKQDCRLSRRDGRNLTPVMVTIGIGRQGYGRVVRDMFVARLRLEIVPTEGSVLRDHRYDIGT